jgi:hypothetical protein
MIYLVVGLIGGLICAMIAPSKRRSPAAWFVIGFLIPLIGLILVLVLPPNPSLDPDDPMNMNLVPEPGPMQIQQQQAATAQAKQDHSIEALQKLAELKEKGVLTEAEFEDKKKELLQQI